MKERPIIFSSEMVRAILEGKKTQTRRIMKPQPPEWIKNMGFNCFTPKGSISGFGIWKGVPGDYEGPAEKFFKMPYGQPKDRLWVKETWAAIHFGSEIENDYSKEFHSSRDIPPGDGEGYWKVKYKADLDLNICIELKDRNFKWRTPFYMPRWASRIDLEITNVRVERVQDISEEDAQTEGVIAVYGDNLEPQWNYREGFFNIWELIHGQGSWDLNPFCWVIEFRRIKP